MFFKKINHSRRLHMPKICNVLIDILLKNSQNSIAEIIKNQHITYLMSSFYVEIVVIKLKRYYLNL
jgi:hypothetical protein